MPTSWIETELKLLLPDEAAWRRIRAALGPGRVVVQINHFFDCAEGAFAAARIAVRLRSEGQRNRLTLKGDELEAAGGALSRRIELETDITKDELEAAVEGGFDLLPWLVRFEAGELGEIPPPELRSFLDRVRALSPGRRLTRQAGFSNRRERLQVELRDHDGVFAIELDLDETRFSANRVDYELEVELDVAPARAEPRNRNPDEIERALRRWLRELAGIAVESAPSKLERLLALPRTAT